MRSFILIVMLSCLSLLVFAQQSEDLSNEHFHHDQTGVSSITSGQEVPASFTGRVEVGGGSEFSYRGTSFETATRQGEVDIQNGEIYTGEVSFDGTIPVGGVMIEQVGIEPVKIVRGKIVSGNIKVVNGGAIEAHVGTINFDGPGEVTLQSNNVIKSLKGTVTEPVGLTNAVVGKVLYLGSIDYEGSSSSIGLDGTIQFPGQEPISLTNARILVDVDGFSGSGKSQLAIGEFFIHQNEVAPHLRTGVDFDYRLADGQPTYTLKSDSDFTVSGLPQFEGGIEKRGDSTMTISENGMEISSGRFLMHGNVPGFPIYTGQAMRGTTNTDLVVNGVTLQSERVGVLLLLPNEETLTKTFGGDPEMSYAVLESRAEYDVSQTGGLTQSVRRPGTSSYYIDFVNTQDIEYRITVPRFGENGELIHQALPSQLQFNGESRAQVVVPENQEQPVSLTLLDGDVSLGVNEQSIDLQNVNKRSYYRTSGRNADDTRTYVLQNGEESYELFNGNRETGLFGWWDRVNTVEFDQKPLGETPRVQVDRTSESDASIGAGVDTGIEDEDDAKSVLGDAVETLPSRDLETLGGEEATRRHLERGHDRLGGKHCGPNDIADGRQESNTCLGN